MRVVDSLLRPTELEMADDTSLCKLLVAVKASMTLWIPSFGWHLVRGGWQSRKIAKSKLGLRHVRPRPLPSPMAQRSYSDILRDLNSKTEQLEGARADKKKLREHNTKLRQQNEKKSKKIEGASIFT
jgi:hypothetical protein